MLDKVRKCYQSVQGEGNKTLIGIDKQELEETEVIENCYGMNGRVPRRKQRRNILYWTLTSVVAQDGGDVPGVFCSLILTIHLHDPSVG